jgi:hypothetical protein
VSELSGVWCEVRTWRRKEEDEGHGMVMDLLLPLPADLITLPLGTVEACARASVTSPS